MNISNIKGIALGIALSATVLGAKAQKTYTEGTVTYSTSLNGQDGETTVIFKGDSSTNVVQHPPATIKMIGTKGFDYLAIVVDVPVVSIKKAAVMNPGELEDIQSKLPTLTFTPTNETKKIGDFNCKKVSAKDTKSGNSFDVWITNDITMPSNILTDIYKDAGGVPVAFPAAILGVINQLTIKSVSDAKVAAGTFNIPADYERISMSDMQAMGGGRKQ